MREDTGHVSDPQKTANLHQFPLHWQSARPLAGPQLSSSSPGTTEGGAAAGAVTWGVGGAEGSGNHRITESV